MKKLPYYLLIFMSCIAISCSKESVDDVTPVVGVETPDEEPPKPDTIPNVVTTPCDFDLSTVAANSTIIFNCVLDLKGETITLPANVKFEFDGGDVKNGKLIFAGGTIAGELLSSNIEIEGDVKLKEPTFKFFASRWEGIVEGTTTSNVALKNNKELERLFKYTKNLGATTFQIGKFDAFFEITKITPPEVFFRASDEAVNIPSDFTLKMTDETFLRAFPAEADKKNGAILAFTDVDNANVIGGSLVGDRNTRAYSSGDVGETGSHLFHIQSGRNVTVDGVKFIDGSKGGVTIYSKGFFSRPDTNYKPSTNVTIKNCVFKDNRRMAISVTDGREIFIEDNSFANTGQASQNSDGGDVGYSINIEAARRRDSSGNLEELQKVFNVFVRRNTETNSRSGFITVNIGQHATVEDNIVGTRISYKLANNTKILNNTLTADGIGLESWAIFASGTGETVFNNEVGGNKISGYKTGIVVASNEAYIHDNTIDNVAVGIQLSRANDPRVIDNTITRADKGITATNTFAKNAEIRGNRITTSNGFHMFFSSLNLEDATTQSYKVNVIGNTLINAKKITISNTYGVIFSENNVTGGIEIGNSNNIEVSGNTKIQPDESDGIRIFGTNNNVTILNNKITEPTGAERYQCINNSASSPNSITLTNNSCN
ncbi:right-handed parallel beta-helix repeat-containing protein [Aquimarina macrocephali]|uniref:right-handed parallel beta-helix repeat-containing protein n=1 Tax=Aquimarina macrocephali TaxID=666563 RepID=UPI0004ADA5C4|nr:right-handed parallel beta-helix repeat-containing protein [Aquimarina macrocephali]